MAQISTVSAEFVVRYRRADVNENTKPRAISVGGSLAGLFNAIMWRSIGWEVDVFERTIHALESRGGGIVLQPEVELALELRDGRENLDAILAHWENRQIALGQMGN